MCVCVCVCVCVWVCVFVGVGVGVFVWVCGWVCVCLWVWVWMYLCGGVWGGDKHVCRVLQVSSPSLSPLPLPFPPGTVYERLLFSPTPMTSTSSLPAAWSSLDRSTSHLEIKRWVTSPQAVLSCTVCLCNCWKYVHISIHCAVLSVNLCGVV